MSELPYKEKIIELFNAGKLKINDAKWYNNSGFSFVCNDGKVVDIVKEAEDDPESVSKLVCSGLYGCASRCS